MNDEFENKIYEGIHYSRFIASWVKVGGELRSRNAYLMKDWLRQLIINDKPIPEEVIMEIYNFATNGKLELQANARNFIFQRKMKKYEDLTL